MSVWLVRHAQDLGASEERFGDLGLSESGQRQARELGERLAKLPFRACLVSPLRRAGETTRLLLGGRDIPVEVDSDLAEGSLGALSGLTREEARLRHPADFRLGDGVIERIAASGHTAPGGETRDAFVGRARRASERVARELRAHGPLLLVSHGGLLNYLLQILLGVPLRDEVPFAFEHAGVAVLRPKGAGAQRVAQVSLHFGVQGADQPNS